MMKKERTENTDIVIMNFSGIYREEQFWKGERVSWVEAGDILGTNCYCDEEAMEEIRQRLAGLPEEGIYFIDSGNYHYISRIRAGLVKRPFRLLVFDNHTDMQLPAFGGLLSCGGWISSALLETGNLREVFLVGPDEEAYGQVEEKFRKRVRLLPGEAWWLCEIPTDLPLYISIDKDVLQKADAATAWSQGDMSLQELMDMLEELADHFQENGGEIRWIDICGECAPEAPSGCEKNDKANKALLKFWKRRLPLLR